MVICLIVSKRCLTSWKMHLFFIFFSYVHAEMWWLITVVLLTFRGNFVIEYVGEVLNMQEFKQRVKQYAREKTHHYYFMALKSDEIIDATNKGNLSRLINHSCDPNCETQKVIFLHFASEYTLIFLLKFII